MDTAEELRYLVLAAQREGNRMLAQALRPWSLTPSQAEVLRVLADYGPLTLTGLGGLLVCESGNNPSRLVDRLVLKGLIERRQSTGDRREVELMLNTDGQILAEQVKGIEEAIHRRIDEVLGGFDVEVTLSLLRRFVSDLPSGQALARRMVFKARKGNNHGNRGGYEQ